MKFLFVMVAAALALGGEMWPPNAPAAPLAGFSFSPETSRQAGRDPVQDLTLLLDATEPDIVRLPVYWDVVEPAPDRLDFSSVDALLKAVARHNRHSSVRTRVVLTIGARNFLYPELHEPAWAGPRAQPYLQDAQSGAAYRRYIDASIARYRSSRLLYAWQVENEPLDYVGNTFTGEDRISADQLAWEVGEVHRLDPAHEAVTTTYDGLNATVDMIQLWTPGLISGFGTMGHPDQALRAGDALGLDLYVDGPSIPLRHVTSVDLREEWKEQAIGFWADRAHARGKELWLAEMQAQPWSSGGAFSPADLVDSAVDYRQENLQVVLMWGVDTWLNDSTWLSAAARAMAILRG